MKVEVRCTECSASWLVDESVRGGELLCSNCLTRISLPGGGDREKAEAVEREAQADRPAAAAETVETPETPAPVAASEHARKAPKKKPGRKEQPGEEIVCPRCQLHFFPWGREARNQSEQRHTVLIVDDLGYFMRAAQDALTPRFIVKTARTTVEARSIVAAGGIDLIVLDLTLDGGRLFLSELAPKPCPILIYTAQDESELYGDSWEELSALGADDLVLKGMNLDETLARKVVNLLGLPVDEDQPIG